MVQKKIETTNPSNTRPPEKKELEPTCPYCQIPLPPGIPALANHLKVCPKAPKTGEIRPPH